MTVSIEDILEDFEMWKNRKKRVQKYNSIVKKEYRKIYEILGKEELPAFEIANKTKNDLICTMKLLTLMEIEDLVEFKTFGYIKK